MRVPVNVVGCGGVCLARITRCVQEYVDDSVMFNRNSVMIILIRGGNRIFRIVIANEQDFLIR